MKSKEILTTLLVSTSIFSSMVSIIPTFAMENNQTCDLQINPLILEFKKRAKDFSFR